MRSIALIIFCLLISFLLLFVLAIVRYYKNKGTLLCVSKKLWLDHVYYTREYLLLSMFNPILTSSTATANRLLQNQVDIGNFFSSYYGSTVGAKVTALLTDHIKIAVSIVDIVKQPTPDPTKLKQAQDAWTQNANDISAALKSVLHIDLYSCMTDHLSTTTQELLDIKGGNFDKAIQDFQQVVLVVTAMAVKIADAIADDKMFTLMTSSTLPCCK